jgi:hypothetical protein
MSKIKLFINGCFIHIRREIPKENLTKFYRIVSIYKYMLLYELNVGYEQKNKGEKWRW